jgi:hypothetical protein
MTAETDGVVVAAVRVCKVELLCDHTPLVSAESSTKKGNLGESSGEPFILNSTVPAHMHMLYIRRYENPTMTIFPSEHPYYRLAKP